MIYIQSASGFGRGGETSLWNRWNELFHYKMPGLSQQRVSGALMAISGSPGRWGGAIVWCLWPKRVARVPHSTSPPPNPPHNCQVRVYKEDDGDKYLRKWGSSLHFERELEVKYFPTHSLLGTWSYPPPTHFYGNNSWIQSPQRKIS